MTILCDRDGVRIDAFLAETVEQLSRSAAQQLLEKGGITVNGKAVKKNYKTHDGDEITVELPEPEPVELLPENIPLDIRYEDEDVVVINKPKGLVVHPAPGHWSGTLVNALMYHCGDSLSGINGQLRPGIVHRIDMDTSGLLIVAKNDFAHQALAEQLKDHSLSRIYEAIVVGNIRADSGTIDAPIGRHPVDRKKMTVTEKNSRPAVTHYQVVARYSGYTHLRLRLETGRTHQIRVHMGYIGHPLPADYLYHPEYDCFKRQPLHSLQLEFRHPVTDKSMCLLAPVPEDMCNAF